MKRGSFIKIIVALFLLGAVLGISVFIISTEIDKTEASKRMTRIVEYVKEQCVLSDDLASDEQTKLMFVLIDAARDIQREFGYDGKVGDARLLELVRENRLTGMIVTDETTGEKKVFSTSKNESSEDWDDVLEKYSSIKDYPEKVYAEQIEEEDGFYCDYAIVARRDGKGVILCFSRKKSNALFGSQLLIKNLLKGYSFEKGGKFVVTDGTTVVASNDEEYIGLKTSECAIVKEFGENDETSDNTMVGVGDYYAISARSRDYYIYVFLPQSAVFINRSLLLAYIALAYFLVISLVFALRRRYIYINQTEKEKNEEKYRAELDKMAEEAIRANNAKTDFLRRMSHDVRTPINGIRGMVKIGDYYPDDVEKQKECREKIWEASGYLLELVNGILDVTKDNSLDFSLKEEPFVLTKLMDEINSIMSYQASEKGITFVAKPSKIEHDRLFGEETGLKRICTNLIGNAIKYNKKNGKVEVSCEERAFDGNKASYRFVFADTGVGMSEEFQKVMFEPFEQETKSLVGNETSFGLGLAIVKKIVDKMNGKISVLSKKGEGTTFVVDLDFALDTEIEKVEEKEKEVDKAEKRLDGVKVLVVEDNEINTEIAEFMLKTSGAQILTASNGKEAVELFKKSKEGEIDVILMDIMMPEMSGMEATKAIRSLSRSDALTVPIIAMTANAFEDDIENTKKAGMNDHLAKPLDLAKLTECIQKYLK